MVQRSICYEITFGRVEEGWNHRGSVFCTAYSSKDARVGTVVDGEMAHTPERYHPCCNYKNEKAT